MTAMTRGVKVVAMTVIPTTRKGVWNSNWNKVSEER
jgi:hypothetical protein